MFRRVLVPVDLSDRNARALRTALELARPRRARVTLLHVIQQVADAPVKELAPFYRRLVTASERRLAHAARPFTGAGCRVTTEVCIGQPAREILRTAARMRADVIVMGSHRVRPGRPASGWGTTSYKVGLLCPSPILLVK